MVETPEQFIALKQKCIKAVHLCIDKAKELGIILKYPKITFDLTGTTAGTANYGMNWIRFQPTLLRENPDDFIRRTVIHECSHLLAFTKYGTSIQPHGYEWRLVDIALGGNGVRCHNYDTKNVASVLGKKLRDNRPCLCREIDL